MAGRGGISPPRSSRRPPTAGGCEGGPRCRGTAGLRKNVPTSQTSNWKQKTAPLAPYSAGTEKAKNVCEPRRSLNGAGGFEGG